MQWCALTSHTLKFREYSKTPSVLFPVIKLKTSEVSKLNFFCLRKLEISEISEFSIWPLYKNRKLGELGNCFKTCDCFAGGSWEFSRFSNFRFWPLYKNRKLGKLGNCFKTCSCFAGGSWKFPRFPSFRFWPLYKNRKLGKLGNCLKTCKVNWFVLFVWGSWKFPRLPSFRFSPLYWQQKLRISDSFSKLLIWVNILFLFEETGKFRVFDFGPYAKIENSQNFSKYFSCF